MSNKEKREFSRIFNYLDKNGDGELDLDEIMESIFMLDS